MATNEENAREIVRGVLDETDPTHLDSATLRARLTDRIVDCLAEVELIAPETRTVYIVKANSDLTEGRGHMVAVAEFDNLDDAYKENLRHGVCGAPSGGEIYEVIVSANGLRGKETKIYGYRQRPDGKWDYGYLDCRDLKVDPEYAEYVRLTKKFGGR